MFKKITVCVLLLIASVLTGCTNVEQNFLEYQTKGFETNASIDINGDKYSVIIKKTGEDQG